MALRFFSEFRNIKKELYKIEIHDDSHTGSATEFNVRGDGFKLNYKNGENTWDLIKSSTLSFIMNIDNSTLSNFISDLSDNDYPAFQIQVYLDESYTVGQNPQFTPDGNNYELFWLGYIENRLITIADTSYPYDLKIVCLDGIERLKTLDYKSSATEPFQDLVTINTHISRILGKIDIFNRFFTTNDMFATRINWYATNSNHSSSNGVFANTKLDSSAFNSFNEQNEVVFSSFYDVLRIICQLFQCRFLLCRGKYYFTHFEILNTSSNIVYNSYRKSGDVSTTPTITSFFNQIKGETSSFSVSQSNEIVRRPGFFQRIKTFGSKLNSVKIRFNGSNETNESNPFNGNLYLLNYFPVWEYENSNWIPYGQDLEGPTLLGFFEATQSITFKINYHFSIRVERLSNVSESGPATISPFTNNSFLGHVVLPFWLKVPVVAGVSSTNQAFWRVVNPITAENSPEPFLGIVTGSWQTTNQNTDFDKAQKFKTPLIEILESADGGTGETYEFNTQVNTTNSEVTESPGVHIYNDYSGSWGSHYTNDNISGYDNNWFAVEDIDGDTIYRADQFPGYQITLDYHNNEGVQVYAYQDLQPFTGSVMDSYVDDNEQTPTNSEQLIINDITFNDGPNTIGEKVIWVNSGSNYIQSSVWKINGTGSGFKIHKLITDLILKYNYNPKELLYSKILMPIVSTNQPIFSNNTFVREFKDENGDDQTEIYCFTDFEFNPQLNQYNFIGLKTSPAITPTIITDDNPESPGPGGGYTNGGFIGNPSNGTIVDLINNDAFGQLNENILSDVRTTSITVSGLDGTGGIEEDLFDGAEIVLMGSNETRNFVRLTVSGVIGRNATSIPVEAFTPNFVLESGAKLIITRRTLMEQVKLNNTDVSDLTVVVNNNKDDISDNATDIATIQSNEISTTSLIVTNIGDIATNTSNISTNANDIDTNEAAITTNLNSITNLAIGIASNTGSITNNNNAISTNTTNITAVTNKANTNETNISTNEGDISQNGTAISLNTVKRSYPLADENRLAAITDADYKNSNVESDDISDFEQSVSNNASVLANTAKVGISTAQATQISANASNISSHTTSIANNTNSISSNSTNISSNQDSIDDNINAIALNTAKRTYPVSDENRLDAITDNLYKNENVSTDDISDFESSVADVPEVVANTAKVGITTTQANQITTNQSNISTANTVISNNVNNIDNKNTIFASTGAPTSIQIDDIWIDISQTPNVLYRAIAKDSSTDWTEITNTTPAGSNHQIQFNDSGSFGAESGFEYNDTSNTLNAENIEGRILGDNAGFKTKWNTSSLELLYYVNPSDFNLSSNPGVIINSKDGGSVKASAYDSRDPDIMAFVQLPVGYKITELEIYSSNSSLDYYLEYGQIMNNSTVTSIAGPGTTNSALTLQTPETIDERRYYILRVEYSATTDQIRGAKITLEKV